MSKIVEPCALHLLLVTHPRASNLLLQLLKSKMLNNWSMLLEIKVKKVNDTTVSTNVDSGINK